MYIFKGMSVRFVRAAHHPRRGGSGSCACATTTLAVEDEIERFAPRERAVRLLRLPPAAARAVEDASPYKVGGTYRTEEACGAFCSYRTPPPSGSTKLRLRNYNSRRPCVFRRGERKGELPRGNSSICRGNERKSSCKMQCADLTARAECGIMITVFFLFQ